MAIIPSYFVFEFDPDVDQRLMFKLYWLVVQPIK